MNTFLKVLLVIGVLLLIAHFWPIALLPLAIGAAVAVVFGSVLAGLIALVAALVAAIIVPLLAVAVVVVTALSPIWIPVLLIAGIISLCRRSRRATA